LKSFNLEISLITDQHFLLTFQEETRPVKKGKICWHATERIKKVEGIEIQQTRKTGNADVALIF
jgi:hypothetical protein